jgi:terminase large subunit-like protein
MADFTGVQEEEELSAAEQEAVLELDDDLDEFSQKTVDMIVDGMMKFCDALSGHPLRPYQTPFARRIFESLVINDGATITALFSRQSGKTETVANCMATAMILLPRLAKVYPDLLEKYREGVWVGAFAPTELQARTLFARIVSRITSKKAVEIMKDPEINDRVDRIPGGMQLRNCRSMVVKNTAHPRSQIESQTFHIILIDECQSADNMMVDKSISPMGTETNSTNIYTGTCTYVKNVFYRDIQTNKREALQRSARQNHFEIPWRVVAKYSKNYKKKVYKEMLKMGADSDEFKLSYECKWMLERGMFTAPERLEHLSDVKMPYTVREYFKTPCVAGIDCARIRDRTIVTVLYVDWNNPDSAGFVHHRVLNWLDLEGLDWETQYHRIMEFLSRYNIWKVGVDGGGVGDVVIDRLRNLMPGVDFVEMGDGPAEQSARWKHLKQLMDRDQISWPGGAKVRELRTWKRFIKEMEDLQIEYKGPNMKCEAPDEANAHDDYPDSLAMAAILSESEDDDSDDMVILDNFFYGN